MTYSSILMVALDVDPAFLKACDQTLDLVLAVCRNYLSPIFLSLAMVVAIGKAYTNIGYGGLAIDFSAVIRIFFMIIVLVMYRPGVDLVSTAVAGVTQLTKPANAMTANQVLDKLTNNGGAGSAPAGNNGNIWDQAKNGLAALGKVVQGFSFVGFVTDFITGLTAMIVRMVMMYIRQFLLGFLYVVGPLAICLSLVPAFSGLFKDWFQNFISVQLWALTYGLLDTMYGYWLDARGAPISVGPSLMNANDVERIGISAAFIIMYIMTPKLTSMIIGSSAAQGAAAMAGGMAAGAAKKAGNAAAALATGGASMAATAANGIATAAQTAGAVADAAGGGKDESSNSKGLPSVAAPKA